MWSVPSSPSGHRTLQATEQVWQPMHLFRSKTQASWCLPLVVIFVPPLTGLLDVDGHRAVYGDRLPMKRPVFEVPVAAGQVEPLDHAGLDVSLGVPPFVHVRLEAVVDDDLVWADGGRQLCRYERCSGIVEDADQIAVLDAPLLRLGVVNEHERLAAVGVLDDVIGQVHGVDAPAVVAAGHAERIAGTGGGGLLV